MESDNIRVYTVYGNHINTQADFHVELIIPTLWQTGGGDLCL